MCLYILKYYSKCNIGWKMWVTLRVESDIVGFCMLMEFYQGRSSTNGATPSS